MTVGVGGTWVAADAPKQVQFFKYYPVASGGFPAGAVTVTAAGVESRTSGLAIENAIAGGIYPLIIENGNAPNVYRPVDILPGTSVVFKSNTFNGDELTLSIPEEGDDILASVSSNIGVLPTVNAQTDVGKVPTVNASGGYSLQTPSGGSITVDSALSTTSTNPVQNKVVTARINELDDLLSDVGGKLLPDVTAADNGKVLKVVNGVWAAVAE